MHQSQAEAASSTIWELVSVMGLGSRTLPGIVPITAAAEPPHHGGHGLAHVHRGSQQGQFVIVQPAQVKSCVFTR
jgi:hypothetical protein